MTMEYQIREHERRIKARDRKNRDVLEALKLGKTPAPTFPYQRRQTEIYITQEDIDAIRRRRDEEEKPERKPVDEQEPTRLFDAEST
jgi:hypothetical protein